MDSPPALPRTGHTGTVVAHYIVGDEIAANGRYTLYLGRSLAGMQEAEIKVMSEEYQEHRFGSGKVADSCHFTRCKEEE